MICNGGHCRFREFHPSREGHGAKYRPMNRFGRYTVTTLLFGLIVMSTVSCAPRLQDLQVSQEVAENLPKEQALRFLQTLKASPERYIQCLFDEEGVTRWQPGTRQVFPGKKPYRLLDARAERPGIMVVVVLYAQGQPWCIIPAESNADDLGRGDVNKFTGKIMTALLSLGVTARSFGKQSVRASQPSS